MDTETIVAALLHDVVEDTPVTLEEVSHDFGQEVALLVDGVTKLGRIPFSSREEQQAENIRKMLLAMAQDVRVIIIKLADRLHNMRTIDCMPDQKRRDKALETMEVYAPLAHRLGIRGIKEELEDLSLRCLDGIAYEEIEKTLALKKEERTAFLNRMKEKIRERVTQEHKNVYIEGRVKSIYGIYRKVYMNGRAFEEIYDIYAIRLIVDTVFDCYNILGIIHDMFRPIPNRFKDYISTPKSNMYQSLHTTVVDKEGIPFEVQIRTWDMHYTAEYGILLDMVGGKNATFFKEQQSLRAAAPIVEMVWSAARDLGYGKYFINATGGALIDDHQYVISGRNIPSIDIINYDPESKTGFASYWHTQKDNMENIDRETLKAAGQTVLEVIYNR